MLRQQPGWAAPSRLRHAEAESNLIELLDAAPPGPELIERGREQARSNAEIVTRGDYPSVEIGLCTATNVSLRTRPWTLLATGEN